VTRNPGNLSRTAALTGGARRPVASAAYCRWRTGTRRPSARYGFAAAACGLFRHQSPAQACSHGSGGCSGCPRAARWPPPVGGRRACSRARWHQLRPWPRRAGCGIASSQRPGLPCGGWGLRRRRARDGALLASRRPLRHGHRPARIQAWSRVLLSVLDGWPGGRGGQPRLTGSTDPPSCKNPLPGQQVRPPAAAPGGPGNGFATRYRRCGIPATSCLMQTLAQPCPAGAAVRHPLMSASVAGAPAVPPPMTGVGTWPGNPAPPWPVPGRRPAGAVQNGDHPRA